MNKILNKQDLFNKITTILTENKFIANTDFKDGRINSVKDEDTIINMLEKSELNEYIVKQGIRKVADIVFKINDELIHFNIKTTDGKSADNIFSKLGTLIAFTDIDSNKLKSSITWNNFTDELFNNCKETSRDYYYLVVDKINSRVMIRGLKELNTIKTNPSNILQVEWYKEFNRPKRAGSFKDSFNYVTGLISESLNKDISGKNNFLNSFNSHKWAA